MTVSTTRARHRAARRPSTPLTELAAAATGQIGTVGRRTAVVAASSGLVVSMLGSPASATAGDAGALPAVDTAALTASARAVLDTAPVVTSPADATWTVDIPAVTAETPPPPPPPVKVKAKAASRSAARAAPLRPPQRPPRPPPSRSRSPATRSSRSPRSTSARRTSPVAARPVASTAPASSPTSTRQLGVSLPRTSSGIKAAGTIISRDQAQPGDLIWSPGHVAHLRRWQLADRLAPPGQDDPVPRHLAERTRLHPDRLTSAARTTKPRRHRSRRGFAMSAARGPGPSSRRARRVGSLRPAAAHRRVLWPCTTLLLRFAGPAASRSDPRGRENAVLVNAPTSDRRDYRRSGCHRPPGRHRRSALQPAPCCSTRAWNRCAS